MVDTSNEFDATFASGVTARFGLVALVLTEEGPAVFVADSVQRAGGRRRY